MSAEAEMYGLSTPDTFYIDDLLDFSNEELFSSSTETDIFLPPFEVEATTSNSFSTTSTDNAPSFPHDLYVPNDDVAELEWLSNFVDDSWSYFPASNMTANTTSVPGKARSKRFKAPITPSSWSCTPESDILATRKFNTLTTTSGSRNNKNAEKDSYSSSSTSSIRGRKCSHCASEQTPQWRTGPMGAKTLCNACGVRYKSGRLVPEYRPAASPTFVLSRHSNSHRKVMELRRQKEVVTAEDSNNNRHTFYHHHHHDFKVC